MKISSTLGKAFSDSMILAKTSMHEFVTPEHLLYSLLSMENVCVLLSKSGSDVKRLTDDIKFFLNTKVPHVKNAGSKGPVESMGFQSVMNRPVFMCVSSERSVVDYTDVLVGMLDENRNYCSYYMMVSGVDRVTLLQEISKIRREEPSQNQVRKEQVVSDDPMVQAAMQNSVANRKNALERFTVDMTAAAAKGEYDRLFKAARATLLNTTMLNLLSSILPLKQNVFQVFLMLAR
jgi:ATP-dependent Clp protease ATP-binding subunit ClpA